MFDPRPWVAGSRAHLGTGAQLVRAQQRACHLVVAGRRRPPRGCSATPHGLRRSLPAMACPPAASPLNRRDGGLRAPDGEGPCRVRPLSRHVAWHVARQPAIPLTTAQGLRARRALYRRARRLRRRPPHPRGLVRRPAHRGQRSVPATATGNRGPALFYLHGARRRHSSLEAASPRPCAPELHGRLTKASQRRREPARHERTQAIAAQVDQRRLADGRGDGDQATSDHGPVLARRGQAASYGLRAVAAARWQAVAKRCIERRQPQRRPPRSAQPALAAGATCRVNSACPAPPKRKRPRKCPAMTAKRPEPRALPHPPPPLISAAAVQYSAPARGAARSPPPRSSNGLRPPAGTSSRVEVAAIDIQISCCRRRSSISRARPGWRA